MRCTSQQASAVFAEHRSHTVDLIVGDAMTVE
jgi:hypothetical protein